MEAKVRTYRDAAIKALENIRDTLSAQQLVEAEEYIHNLSCFLDECNKQPVVVDERGDNLLLKEMERMKQYDSLK